MRVVQAYRFALDPSPAQERALRSHAGAARFAWNWAWWGENSKCVYQEAFRDLDRALRDFSKSKNGARNGRRLGFPRRPSWPRT
jgi:putative transposase